MAFSRRKIDFAKMADRHGVKCCHPDGKPKTPRLQELTQALAVEPECAKLWVERGIIHLEMDNYYAAADDFSQAIRICPLFAQAYYKRSQVYYMLGKEHLAAQDRQQAKWLYTDHWR
ncbi:MAG TPA: hypothetical protein V6D22_18115 [Candidatus Obscuribacterales bacterium]